MWQQLVKQLTQEKLYGIYILFKILEAFPGLFFIVYWRDWACWKWQIEELVNENLQEGSTIKILIYIFPAIVQQNLTSQLEFY